MAASQKLPSSRTSPVPGLRAFLLLKSKCEARQFLLWNSFTDVLVAIFLIYLRLHHLFQDTQIWVYDLPFRAHQNFDVILAKNLRMQLYCHSFLFLISQQRLCTSVWWHVLHIWPIAALTCSFLRKTIFRDIMWYLRFLPVSFSIFALKKISPREQILILMPVIVAKYDFTSC